MAAQSRFVLIPAICLLLSLAGCETNRPADEQDPPPLPTTDGAGGKRAAADESDAFFVKFETSKGNFTVKVVPAWAPEGAKRFRELVESGYFDDCRIFRVMPGFMAQFGINGDPELNRKWRSRNIKDDPVVKSNQRGFVTFAKTGAPNSRSTQVFINFGDNSRLDADRFAPFGEVVEGMKTVDRFNSQYGEEASQHQGEIQDRGNEWLDKSFPGLDTIKSAKVVDQSEVSETKKPELKTIPDDAEPAKKEPGTKEPESKDAQKKDE